MSFVFKKGLENVVNAYEKWWNHEQGRLMLPVVVGGEPQGAKPKALLNRSWAGCSQGMFSDLSLTPKDIIDCVEYGLSGNEYLGDAYPVCNTSFSGPGIVAAFLGSEIKVISDGNWFDSIKNTPIQDLHPQYDPNNLWLNRMKDIMAEGMKRWGGEVVVGMPDLGGTMDVLSSLRGNETLLTDLYDHPGEVKRLVHEVGALWMRYYNELATLGGPGYIHTDWSCIPSRQPSYILQSDFIYMIGTDMFNEFARDELAARCQDLARPTYHLDGPGQLPHLDSILAINNLRMVQWVPGDGTIPINEWGHVNDKILDAGRLLFHCDNSPLCGWETQLDGIGRRRGTLKGVAGNAQWFNAANRVDGLRLLEKYGVEA
jgi:5-methyltetrahydrofolate--homocysteine methyltransferase